MTTNSFDLTLELLSLGECEAEHPFSFEFPSIEQVLIRSKKKKKKFLPFSVILETFLNLKK